jgi:hypothetical protein
MLQARKESLLKLASKNGIVAQICGKGVRYLFLHIYATHRRLGSYFIILI